jgi:hypothetical protein
MGFNNYVPDTSILSKGRLQQALRDEKRQKEEPPVSTTKGMDPPRKLAVPVQGWVHRNSRGNDRAKECSTS